MRYGTEIWHKEGSVGERRKDKALDWDQALTHLHVLRSGLGSDPGATEGLEVLVVLQPLVDLWH